MVLPGPKVKKDAPTTESYLRHYPNPKVRAHPGQHDYHDVLMKQRVADTMLHKVVGAEADSGRVSIHFLKFGILYTKFIVYNFLPEIVYITN